MSIDDWRVIFGPISANRHLRILMLQECILPEMAAVALSELLCGDSIAAVGLANNFNLGNALLEKMTDSEACAFRGHPRKGEPSSAASASSSSSSSPPPSISAMSLVSLDLTRTGLDDEACRKIGIVLRIFTHLQKLYLSFNILSDSCIALLLPSLTSHAHLEALDLSYNTIAMTGAVQLIQLLDSIVHPPLTFLDLRNNHVQKHVLDSLQARLDKIARQRQERPPLHSLRSTGKFEENHEEGPAVAHTETISPPAEEKFQPLHYDTNSNNIDVERSTVLDQKRHNDLFSPTKLSSCASDNTKECHQHPQQRDYTFAAQLPLQSIRSMNDALKGPVEGNEMVIASNTDMGVSASTPSCRQTEAIICSENTIMQSNFPASAGRQVTENDFIRLVRTLAMHKLDEVVGVVVGRDISNIAELDELILAGVITLDPFQQRHYNLVKMELLE